MRGNSISKKKKLIVRSNVLHNQHKDCKILLLSDGHGRGCAERLKNQLPSNFEASGFNNALLEKYCIEMDTEVCACKLIFINIRLIVITVYR
jgi:hypothetical protein